MSVVKPPHELVEPTLGVGIDFGSLTSFGDEYPEAALGHVGRKAHHDVAKQVEEAEGGEWDRACAWPATLRRARVPAEFG